MRRSAVGVISPGSRRAVFPPGGMAESIAVGLTLPPPRVVSSANRRRGGRRRAGGGAARQNLQLTDTPVVRGAPPSPTKPEGAVAEGHAEKVKAVGMARKKTCGWWHGFPG